MAPWIGDEDDWWNYSVQRETEADVAADPGPLAFFGPGGGTGAGSALASVGTRARAAGVVGADALSGVGPTSSAIEATTGIDSSELLVDAGEDAADTIRDTPIPDPNDPDSWVPSWLKWATGGLVALVGLMAFSYTVGQLFDINLG